MIYSSPDAWIKRILSQTCTLPAWLLDISYLSLDGLPFVRLSWVDCINPSPVFKCFCLYYTWPVLFNCLSGCQLWSLCLCISVSVCALFCCTGWYVFFCLPVFVWLFICNPRVRWLHVDMWGTLRIGISGCRPIRLFSYLGSVYERATYKWKSKWCRFWIRDCP